MIIHHYTISFVDAVNLQWVVCVEAPDAREAVALGLIEFVRQSQDDYHDFVKVFLERGGSRELT